MYDTIYLGILLTGVLLLLENRLKKILILLGIQGVLLVGPVIQSHTDELSKAIILSSLVIFFKGILTPSILYWKSKKMNIKENTDPRFGFITILFFLMVGLFFLLPIVNYPLPLPEDVNSFDLLYVLLFIYIGILAFLVRIHWVPLIVGFAMFENGIFTLTMLLRSDLPFGIELGSFIDALLVIVAAVSLQMENKNPSKEVQSGVSI
jgi:hydrogenase-4 component E